MLRGRNKNIKGHDYLITIDYQLGNHNIEYSSVAYPERVLGGLKPHCTYTPDKSPISTFHFTLIFVTLKSGHK